MNQRRSGLGILLTLAGVLALAACGGGGGNNARVQGSLNGGTKYSLSPQQAPQGLQLLQSLGVQGVNQLLRQRLGLQQDPIRGLNALVLSEALATQAGKKALFDTDEKKVVAVDKDGKIVAQMDVDAQGNFEGDVPTGQDTLLVVAHQEGNSTICESPLEVDPTPATATNGQKGQKNAQNSSDNKLALFNFSAQASGASLAAPQKVGLFAASEDTGHNASAQSQVTAAGLKTDSATQNTFKTDSDGDGVINPVDNCGDAANTARPKVQATFQWDIPGLSASGGMGGYNPDGAQQFMYQYALGLTLEVSNPNDLENATADLLGLGTLEYGTEAGEGVGRYVVQTAKKKGQAAQNVLSLMTDVGLFDLTKLGFPLFPTFHLEAAIDPNNPLSTLGDSDLNYGNGQILADDMYHLYGQTESGALVLAVLNRDNLLAFNIAIADSAGRYRILVPAVPPMVGRYYFLAIDAGGQVHCSSSGQVLFDFPPAGNGTDYGDANGLYGQVDLLNTACTLP
ncbi:hypothetical protein Mlute_00145 [Meiothermus luteus]|uniref:Uncharacterized protein n=1 Tax=Meiothermus luteus TaxID=2026184 RepID=A0A399F2M1_9DEIN|nr:hypothetical protein [Meiothermus luteus]RIH90025.1 hypothetical protein Mlute_00145 [Meiothermus luteus]